jgi:hypothetical protein
VVAHKQNGNGRLAALSDDDTAIEVVETHVTRRRYGLWMKTDLLLLPTCRRVRLKSNPDVVATVRCRVQRNECGVPSYIIADARNSEWIGPEGGNYVFGLAEQLEAERLVLEGL